MPKIKLQQQGQKKAKIFYELFLPTQTSIIVIIFCKTQNEIATATLPHVEKVLKVFENILTT
jgi:hypothetical protein